MIQTYKIKHGKDFSKELLIAEKIAKFAIKTKSRSSADVKHFGLKSVISNKILKKYSSNKTIKCVNSVKLTIPAQSIKIIDNNIYIHCMNLRLSIWFPQNFKKINQIELGNEYAYISVTYIDDVEFKTDSFFGIDRNTTGHCLVASNISTGKVFKLGKSANHIHNKYKHIRKNLQKQGKYRFVKKIKNRESRIIRNLNHNCSKKIITECINSKSGIVMEDLKNIRNTKQRRKQRYSLNSWSFYQLKMMIEYKAKKQGIPIFYVAPQYTSQRCNKCGHIESANRKGKLFQCKKCGKVENADVNAGFNIAELHQLGISQFTKDSDLVKGNTDVPKVALVN